MGISKQKRRYRTMRLNHDKGQNKWTLYTHTHTHK